MTYGNDYMQPRCKMLTMGGAEATMLSDSDKHDEYSSDDQLANEGYFEDIDRNWGYRPQEGSGKKASVWDE